MTENKSEAACTPSFSSAELERTVFERWYSNDGQWSNGIERSGEGYKYQGADHAWRVWQVAVKFEREACAKVCESYQDWAGNWGLYGNEAAATQGAKDCAAAIRLRSNEPSSPAAEGSPSGARG